jgi:hypothetical protein
LLLLWWRRGATVSFAELHRVRGEMLLKRDPINPVAAQEAAEYAQFRTSAALALAKFYQSTSRPAEANAVLAPALEGFSPTPEMREIGEALELMAAIEANAQL